MRNCLGRGLVLAALGGLLVGCIPEEGPAPEAGISPGSAAPGETVRVVLASASPSKGEQTAIEIGEQVAKVARVISESELEVLVPSLPAGQVKVVAREGQQVVGEGNLTVLAPTSKSLVLSFQDDKVALLATAPAGGGWWEAVDEGGRRLSFDVLSEQGGLVFTGAVNHPTLGRIEVFEGSEPRQIHAAPVPTAAVFAIKVPSIPGAATVRIYDVEAGVDLSTAEGRAARRFLSEIMVND